MSHKFPRGGYFRPSHRDPDQFQTEVCELCGALVERSALMEVDIEGLRGYAICNKHPHEAKTRNKPSYRDYRKIGPRPVQQVPERLPPLGGELWFEE